MTDDHEKEILAKYFSHTSHELRTQIVVIREGISQVLDSKGKKEWKPYMELLTLALECTDKLNSLIGEMLTLPALEEFKEGEEVG